MSDTTTLPEIAADTCTGVSAPPPATGGPTAEHDTFLRTVLGIDPGSYVCQAAPDPAAGVAAPGVAPNASDDAGQLPAAPAGGSPADAADTEGDMGRGAGPANAQDGGQKPLDRVLLGMPQREQAGGNLEKMSEADQKEVMSLLTQSAAHSPEESEYVVKALAAGHSLAELKQFQAQIAGKDKAWMEEHLRLVGSSSGKGIKQQWSHSCAPTEVEAMKGELDPIYAFQLRQKNPKLDQANDKDGSAVNPDLANEQFNLLTQTGGAVAPRENADGSGHGGKMSTLLNSEGSGMGLKFDRREVGSDITMNEALSTAQERLKMGLPVPISVGDDGNPYAHAAMITGVEDGPPRRFSIHDPWTGSVKVYSEEDIASGKLDVGSCKKLAAIYPPSRK